MPGTNGSERFLNLGRPVSSMGVTGLQRFTLCLCKMVHLINTAGVTGDKGRIGTHIYPNESPVTLILSGALKPTGETGARAIF